MFQKSYWNFYLFVKWYQFCWRIFTLFWNGTIFVEDFWPFSEIVSFLLRNFDPFLTEMISFMLTIFDPFLKWYHFCFRFLTLFWNGTISVEEFWPFSEIVPFLFTIFDPLLKWYHFYWGILTLFWNGTIFVKDFYPFLKWYHFYWGFLTLFWNGTIFFEEFWPFSEMVPFMLKNFDHFLTKIVPFLLTIFVKDFWLKWYFLKFLKLFEHLKMVKKKKKKKKKKKTQKKQALPNFSDFGFLLLFFCWNPPKVHTNICQDPRGAVRTHLGQYRPAWGSTDPQDRSSWDRADPVETVQTKYRCNVTKTY